MLNTQLDAGVKRREIFRLAATAGIALWAESYALAASDFWNKKGPSEWTDQEKEEIRTKSPWAKKVDAESAGGGRGGGGGGDEGGGGGGGGRGGGRGGGGGGGGIVPQGSFGGGVPLHIVWQSARPILDAHPLKLPEKLDNHYILAVTGIPQQTLQAAMRGGGGGRGFSGGGGRFGGGRDGGPGGPGGPPPGSGNVDNAGGPPGPPPDPTAGLKRGATLTAKGKTPQNADIVLSIGQNNATVLFAFPKDALAFTVADKEAELDLKLGGLTAKAKFNLKDMMYGETLAL